MEAARCSGVAGGDRSESMAVSEKSPIYSDGDGDWQAEREYNIISDVSQQDYRASSYSCSTGTDVLEM